MSNGGFGKLAGPNSGTRAEAPSFRSPPHPPSRSLTRSPRDLEALDRIYAQPSASESGHQVVSPSRPYAGIPSQSLPEWGSRKRVSYSDLDGEIFQNSSEVMPFITPSNSRIGVTTNASETQFRRTRLPSSLPSDEEVLRNTSGIRGSRADLRSKIESHFVPQQTQSPHSAFQGNPFVDGHRPPFGESQPPAVSSPTWVKQSKFVDNLINPLAQPVTPSVSATNVVTHEFQRKSPSQHTEMPVSKRSRSPNFHSNIDTPASDSTFGSYESHRASTSPPNMRSTDLSTASGPQSYQQSLASERYTKGGSANKPTSFPVAKKTKLPSSSTSDQFIQEDSISTQDETNRELEAKAKRLVRFKDELSQPTESDVSLKNQNVPAKRLPLSMMERSKLTGESTVDKAEDISNGHESSDYRVDSSSIITGTCLDMCPGSERAERERKGDLDQYERLDGDRNQSSKSLAVKKYNRTAEREAGLIRPMPILQKTMHYLLDLLDQPYDDSFLGLYNFLWDRMRAIRMDLRMQHIFSLGAIEMLEQMIRLHIIAMHELCEYTKGEGFSEGFDAHLNIEQMNKTSVELFQLYEDHRKKGTNVITEKEFRGYYALLKLDKHPGYKVEPAELSLDLAKMTPDMRQTPEVVFARGVARACRTGNFITFFRLARKASYLQACLMHAHFSKLRTQALASLHGGLQNNQGIPVAHVAKWLGMEEEDIEGLLEYHGFSVREFEEPFMVKEGPFLNVDNDYPVKCSRLVHRKKSSTIVEDVSYPCLVKSSPEESKELQLNDTTKKRSAPSQSFEREDSLPPIDEEIPDYSLQLKEDMLDKPAVTPISIPEYPISPANPSMWDSSSFHSSPKSQVTQNGSSKKFKYDTVFRNSLDRGVEVDLEETSPHVVIGQVGNESFAVSPVDSVTENSPPEHYHVKGLEEQNGFSKKGEEDEMTTTYYDEEVAEAKLKLVLRIWKRRSSKKRELREQKQLAANIALSSLSLGPRILCREIQSSTSTSLNIDSVMSKRYAIQEKSWSRLNISEVVTSTLDAKNPDAKCLCWKILLCTEEDSSYEDKLGKKRGVGQLAATSWLLSKLVPTSGDDGGGLTFSSQGLAIWRKWYSSKSAGELACCLTVVREAKSEILNEIVAGTSAILFIASEYIPWELQRDRLRKILMAVPPGSCLPLLILSGSCRETLDPSTIIKELGLYNIEKSKMKSFKIAFLQDQQMEQFNVFFRDEQLREGLDWLASESPLQPVLSQKRTRELVLFHLNSSLEGLIDGVAHGLGPNGCISAFNEAIDLSLAKVAAAVHANPISWPCPEIVLLDRFSSEYKAVSCYFPSLGWSLPERTEPIIHALIDSKLPPFEDDISWLYRGANGVDDIENQRLMLENCLIKYFTESSRMMLLPMAKKEACLMMQKFARLELRNSTFCILPQWVKIFQRVFHWRLMKLSSSAFSSAYVLVQDNVSLSTSGVLDKIDGSMPLPSYLAHPTFDEMVGIGYSTLTPRVLHLDSEAPNLGSNGYETAKTTIEDNLGQNQGNAEEMCILVTKDDSKSNETNNRSECTLAAAVEKEANKLSKLFEKCDIMQNRVQEKLSIYF